MQTIFAFEAVSPNGSLERGLLDADSPEHARALVASRGLMVLGIQARGVRRERRHSISAADLALGLRVLGDLLESGLSVTRALAAFDELAPKSWRESLPHIRQSVREGKSLAAALDAAPLEIPALVIGIAQAGEAGSGIGPAVRRAAELCESSAEMRAAVRSALAYPIVVAIAGVLAVSVLITVVLPRFAKILSDLGQNLPASTQLVLHLSDIARAGLLPIAIGGGVVIAVWRSWVRTAGGRVSWHDFLLRLPFLGDLRLGAGAARMANSLSALLESGVPIAPALGLAARASGDAAIEQRLLEARASIVAGVGLSHALEATRATTGTVVRLIRAGEESGRLPAMLTHAARIEQKRVDQFVRTAVRMLEPALLLTFASVVALIAAALLQAIYSVRPTA